MVKISCPACGAEVKFRSASSVFAVCSYCHSSVVLNGVDAETIGKMSDMPQDMSPLQIGTTGIFEGKKFEILGRAKVGWSSGQWNEWYILFDDGRDGWLADAQGFYMLSFEKKVDRLPKSAEAEVGQTLTIAGMKLTVDDRREVKTLSSEGELPLQSRQGRSSISCDLKGDDGVFAGIDYGADVERFFLGKYVEFDALKFQNLRQFDGW